jgi:hypothetical protein
MTFCGETRAANWFDSEAMQADYHHDGDAVSYSFVEMGAHEISPKDCDPLQTRSLTKKDRAII